MRKKPDTHTHAYTQGASPRAGTDSHHDEFDNDPLDSVLMVKQHLAPHYLPGHGGKAAPARSIAPETQNRYSITLDKGLIARR